MIRPKFDRSPARDVLQRDPQPRCLNCRRAIIAGRYCSAFCRGVNDVVPGTPDIRVTGKHTPLCDCWTCRIGRLEVTR